MAALPRSRDPLTMAHLDRLPVLASADREDLFARCPHLAGLRLRILSVALCQGAALHWLDGKNGVKDLDVWTLYADGAGATYPYRRTGELTDCDTPGLTGWMQKVDFLGRSVPSRLGTDPAQVWQRYLRDRSTTTARELARKAVVLLEPRRGEVVWRPEHWEPDAAPAGFDTGILGELDRGNLHEIRKSEGGRNNSGIQGLD